MPIVHGFGHGVIHQGPPLLVSISPMAYSPALWLDASDQSTMYQERTGASATTLVSSDADPVGTWRDKSGNARHVTATSDSKRPTYKTAIQNGKSGIVFDSVDDNLQTASAFTGSSNTLFAVVNPLSDTQYVLFRDTEINNYMVCGDSASSTSTLSQNSGTITYYVNGPSQAWATRIDVYTTLTNRASILTLTGVNFSAWTSSFALSGYPSPFQYAGRIHEILLFGSALSTSQRQQVERYLGNKWGISVS